MARGPGYPYINLADAVGLARKLYDYTKRSPANLNAALKDAWGYSLTSSSGIKVVAAMRYFGLVEVTESKTPDKPDTVRLTDRAYRILVDDGDSPERAKAIRAAMLAPKAYKLCWDTWGADLPPSMRSSLIFDRGFIDASVDGFLANYKKSLDFSGLVKQKNTGYSDDDENSVENSAVSGDNIESAGLQSVSQDAIKPEQHPKPKDLAHIEALPGQAFFTARRTKGMRQEVFVLTEGDVTISFPETISPDSFEDFSDWLAILLRKMKRNIAKPTPDVLDNQG